MMLLAGNDTPDVNQRRYFAEIVAYLAARRDQRQR